MPMIFMLCVTVHLEKGVVYESVKVNDLYKDMLERWIGEFRRIDKGKGV